MQALSQYHQLIVTTPTQPQLNSKDGCDTKMTLITTTITTTVTTATTTMTPTTLTTLTTKTSTTSHLIGFQPKFKGMFLGSTTGITTTTT